VLLRDRCPLDLSEHVAIIYDPGFKPACVG
jgi:hypothetical protein